MDRLTPPNARSAVELLRQLEWNWQGYCPICQGWEVIKGQGCLAKRHTKDCRLAAFLAADPQQDWASHRANMSEGEWAALQQDNDEGQTELNRDNAQASSKAASGTCGPSSPIQVGEVAALIERLRYHYETWRSVEALRNSPTCSDVARDMDQAADMLASLAAERNAAYERCAKECDKGARICAELGLSNDMERRNGWLGAAAACRALAAPANAPAQE